MKKQYTFKDNSRLTLVQNEQPLRDNQYISNKLSRQAWTDLRIQEIKKKYQTPSTYLNRIHHPETRNTQNNDTYTPKKKYCHQYQHLTAKNQYEHKKRARNHDSQNIPSFGVEPQEEQSLRASNFMNNNYYHKTKNAQKIERNSYHTHDHERIQRNSLKSSQFMNVYTKNNEHDSNSRQVLGNRINTQASSIKNLREYPHMKIDPRVKNIDKINMKIKNILQCLHENDYYMKKNTGYMQNNKNSQPTSFNMIKDYEVISRGSEEFEETKILDRCRAENYRDGNANYRALLTRNDKLEKNQKKEKVADSPVHMIFQSRAQLSNLKESTYRSSIKNIRKSRQFNHLSINSNKKFQKNTSYTPNKLENPRTNTDTSWFHEPKPSDIKPQQPSAINRSKSCLNGFKSNQNINNNLVLNSGKILNQQILKINNRIKESQQEKKRLNIEFRPFNCSELSKNNKSTTNLNNGNECQNNSKSFRNFNKPPLPKAKLSEFQSKNQHKYQKSELQQNFYNQRVRTENNYETEQYSFQRKESNEGKKARLETSYEKYQGKSREESLKDSHTNSIKEDNETENSLQEPKVLFRDPSFRKDINERRASITPSERQSSRNLFQQQQLISNSQKLKQSEQKQKQQKINNLKKTTTQGINNRNQKLLKLETATTSFARETKRLINALFQQSKIDEQFRNSKIWFRDYCLGSQKWHSLSSKIQSSTKTIKAIQDIRTQFQVTEQQDNPFYSSRQNQQQNYDKLIQNWINAQTHWRQNIKHCFNLKQFLVEKFTNQKIDLERKGYFCIEDLVRFLNMETGTFYRNRDLILIFKRLSKGHKLVWGDFMKQLDQTMGKNARPDYQRKVDYQQGFEGQD